MMPTMNLNITGVWRVQNLPLFRTYYAKKQAIQGKSIPALPSTQVLKQFGGLNTIFLDTAVNEFYMWHYAPNAMDVTNNGAPLKRAINTN